jgi:hypothetical protein
LSRFAVAGYKQGAINGVGKTNKKTPAIEASVFGDQDAAHYGTGFPTTPLGSAVYFDCFDSAEATRFFAEINQFIATGYKIVVSSGQWFLDMSSFTPYNGPLAVSYYSFIAANSGLAIGNLGSSIFFTVSDSDNNPLFPIGGVDPSQIKIYAVPAAIPIAGMQVVFSGAALNKKTVPIGGEKGFSSGILSLTPSVSGESGALSTVAIPFSVGYDDSMTEIHDTGAGVEVRWSGSGMTGLTITESGSTDDINTNPTLLPGPGITLGAVSGLGAEKIEFARMKLRAAVANIGAAFISSDFSYLAGIKFNFAASSGYKRCNIIGPFCKDVTIFRQFYNPAAVILTFQGDAKRNRVFPNWRTTAQSLTDIADYISPSIGPSDYSADSVTVLSLKITEIFLWAHNQISLSDIYSTVYPFWTRKSCGALAYGAGTIVAGGTGRGTAIQANGAITWAPFDLPVPTGGVAAVTGTAYGTLASTPVWVTVGTITVGATVTPTAWLSWDDGVTWTTDAAYQTASNPTNIRFLNGAFVATRTDGHLDMASGFSMPNLIWTSAATGATQLNDIAFGTGRYLMVGNGDQAKYSSNLTAFTDWAASTGKNLLCVCYSQSSIGGFFHVGYGDSGAGGGTLFRKYDGSVPTWTDFDPAGAIDDAVFAIADCSGDVIAVSRGGLIFARSPAYSDVSWKRRSDMAIDSFHDRFGVVVFSGGGQDNIVVGGSAQINTSSTLYQGFSASYFGIGIPDWTPWGTRGASQAVQFLETQCMGGTSDNWNPIQWQRAAFPLVEAFGLAVPPPSATESVKTGTTALDAARQICDEWWIFSGDLASLYLDGSADSIEDPDESDPTAIALGNIEDCFNQITVQYKPFGGNYLGKAYIQNVDVAYVSGNDAFYFAGWDDTGNAFGLALWQACRDAYLETGSVRETTRNFDSIQSASSMGAALGMTSLYLGNRIDWICRRPKYYTVTIDGNESAAAQAHVGSFYKVNPLFLAERGLALGGSRGTGLVVNESHNITAGKHTLQLAFKP